MRGICDLPGDVVPSRPAQQCLLEEWQRQGEGTKRREEKEQSEGGGGLRGEEEEGEEEEVSFGGGGGAAVRTQPVRQAGSTAVRADARMGRGEVGLGGLQKNNIARSGRRGDCGVEAEPVRPTRSMALEERTRKHAIRCSCRSFR